MTAKSTASHPVSLASVLTRIEEYLRYQQEEGRTTIPADPNLVKALGDAAGGKTPSRPKAAVRPEGVSTRQPADSAKATEELETIARAIAECRQCGLSDTRTRTVPGQGNPRPEIMFVGEGPGAEEDEQGLAFVGAAGQLLTKMIEAMGFTRDQVFIGNIVKCRPPNNRQPAPDEMQKCLPYLRAQIAILKPRVIVALGAIAARGLLDVETGITRLRGKWQSYEDIPVMPTFHPSYLLRAPSAKRDAWEDLKEVLRRLGRTPPPRATR